ncbi:MAG: FeoA family protein [Fibrobacteraceae bacterium]|nr:FeoA family protein [Fibrobacteraceae bacterium]
MACVCKCDSSVTPKDWGSDLVAFRDLKPGDSAEIVGYADGGDLNYKVKLLTLGLLRGRVIKVLQVAPFGDPVEILVMSYRLSLRKKEAAVLKLRRV